MIKCVVFDFDGTLVDSNDIKRETFFDIARCWDPAGGLVSEILEGWPDADRYEKTRRIAAGLISRKLLPKEASLETWAARLADDYTERCEKAIVRCGEMPGAGQTLAGLAENGYLLFINSATPSRPLRRVLKLRGWDHYFHAVYGAEASKADNLRSIALETGKGRQEIVHVGDQPDDRRGAGQFGCYFVAMAAGNADSAVRDWPLRVDDLRELPALLNRLSLEAS
jgi:phosphoglycolate phosphatase